MKFGLDLAAGCRIAADEKYGDWYRDPWGWPEFSWLAGNTNESNYERHIRRRNGGLEIALPSGLHLMQVPKNRLALRPAVVQDSLSRLLYASAVASNRGRLHADLAPWVYGWRVREDGEFAKNRIEWRNYLKSFPANDSALAGLHVDVASFFASVDVERLIENVYTRLGRQFSSGLIESMLRTHDSLTTRSGLPQRSFASAALAHIYLQPIDDVLSLYAKSGIFVARWMDDITAIGPEEELYGLYLNLQERMAQLGLTPNAAKSRLGDVKEILEFIREEEPRRLVTDAVTIGEGYAGPTVVRDLGVLLNLEDEYLDGPARIARTKLRDVLTSLVENEQFDRWDEWLGLAHSMPHAADALGRYLREGAAHDEREGSSFTSRWAQLQSYLLDFVQREWGKVDWVTAQIALAVPSAKMNGRMTELMRTWLAGSASVQKLAIATQRLETRHSMDCREIIRSRLDQTVDPVLLRVLALGLLNAGDDHTLVRSVLDRDGRNCLVLSMLSNTNWRPVRPSGDFDSPNSTES